MATPPSNPIIGKVRADKWDQSIGNIESQTADAITKIDEITAKLGLPAITPETKLPIVGSVSVVLQIVILVKLFFFP